MAAVAGDADNINKQARKKCTNWVNSPERANWVNAVKNKQTANGFLRSAPAGGCPCRLQVPLMGPPPFM